MNRIHGRLPDGTIIEGVEVFRRPIALDGMRPMGQGSPALEFPSKAGQTVESGA